MAKGDFRRKHTGLGNLFLPPPPPPPLLPWEAVCTLYGIFSFTHIITCTPQLPRNNPLFTTPYLAYHNFLCTYFELNKQPIINKCSYFNLAPLQFKNDYRKLFSHGTHPI